MRRVVVTGLGMVTPLGWGVEPTWKAILAGKSGAGRITAFDPTDYACQVACEVPESTAAAAAARLPRRFDPDR
jgi:3-oxoacyl-[acyl-carrier-protein] synthase II